MVAKKAKKGKAKRKANEIKRRPTAFCHFWVCISVPLLWRSTFILCTGQTKKVLYCQNLLSSLEVKENETFVIERLLRLGVVVWIQNSFSLWKLYYGMERMSQCFSTAVFLCHDLSTGVTCFLLLGWRKSLFFSLSPVYRGGFPALPLSLPKTKKILSQQIYPTIITECLKVVGVVDGIWWENSPGGTAVYNIILLFFYFFDCHRFWRALSFDRVPTFVACRERQFLRWWWRFSFYFYADRQLFPALFCQKASFFSLVIAVLFSSILKNAFPFYKPKSHLSIFSSSILTQSCR